MLLSVVVPLYNTEKYIAKCLDSILNQGLDANQYEVIVVNDGSTDSGPEIVAEYCGKYSNIRMLTQTNGGLSSARNLGIREARGEYLHFVDSDDYIEVGAYNHIFNNLLKNRSKIDLIRFGSVTVDKFVKLDNLTPIDNSRIFFEGSLRDYLLSTGSFLTFVWWMFVRRELLIENNLTFNVAAYGCEDLFFNFELAKLPQIRIVACNTNVYRYVMHESSISTGYEPNHIRRVLGGFECVFNEFKLNEKYFDDEFKPLFDRQHSGLTRLFATRMLSAKFGYSEVKERLEMYFRDGVFPIKGCSKVDKFLDWLCKHPRCFYFVSIFYRGIFLPYLKRFVPRN